MTNLEEKIIEIVKDRDGVDAKSIADIIGVEKRRINSLLYGSLKGKVFQDKKYKWYLSERTQKQTGSAETSYAKNPISRISKYYLECLGRDIDVEVSVFASSKYDCPEYGQLSTFPLVGDAQMEFGECENKVAYKVSQDRSRLNLVMGYPLYLHEFTSRKGTTYQKVEPLFLFHFDQGSVHPNTKPVLTDMIPHINGSAFKHLTGSSGTEILTEMIGLYEELGIDENEDSPEWDDVFYRLQAIRDEWPWQEDLDVLNISKTAMSGVQEPGIYNTVGIFASERSKYTVGLERELNDLMNKTEADLRGTALNEWVNRDLTTQNKSEYELIEPLPMNEEQRMSVEKSLTQPLTVITGPPGTGKSQVVTNILVNAVYNGQRVIFASKNHKAVDVVNERVNGLSTRPMVIRLGSSEARGRISEYMTSLLSSTVTERDRTEFKTLKQKNEVLQNELNRLLNLQRDTVQHRNKLDEFEQYAEEFREILTEDLFQAIKYWDEQTIIELRDLLKGFSAFVDSADRNKQNILKKWGWFVFRKKSFGELLTHVSVLNRVEKKFGLLETSISLNDFQNEEAIIERLRKRIKNLDRLIDISMEVKKYFQLLSGLNEKPTLFTISAKLKNLYVKIYENSQNLWDYYSKLLPDRLNESDRKLISDFATILKMITQADEQGTTVEKKVWAMYYNILPKISGIFSAWAITSLSVRGRVPSEAGFFDLVVIDEASQCDIASAIPLLYRAKRAVIIGDPNQLRHISMLNKKEDHQILDRYGLLKDFLSWSYSSNSLFDLAASIGGSDSIINLRDHHRSHSNIIEFSNKEFYDESLRVATNYDNLNTIPDEPALNWKHYSGKAIKHSGGGATNRGEAQAIIQELTRLIDNNYRGTIGVVTPFRQQANLIRELVDKDQRLFEQLSLRSFLVDTVHKFQGDERDVMIFSPVYSSGMPQGSEIFLKRNGNLFNVAITRARASLIVVGDKIACQRSEVGYLRNFAAYIDQIEEEKLINEIPLGDLGPTFPDEYKSPTVSDWEVFFYEQLYAAGIRAIPQFEVGQYRLDLALIDGERKLDIEVDGEHYHRNWDGELIWRDQIRNMRLIEDGWDVKRFWVYEIRDDTERCVNEVKKWINAASEK